MYCRSSRNSRRIIGPHSYWSHRGREHCPLVLWPVESYLEWVDINRNVKVSMAREWQ